MIPVLVAIVALLAPVQGSRVFQGECSDRDMVCEQLCMTTSEVTYECGCWDEHSLQDDGLSCKAYSSVQFSEERVPDPTTSSKKSSTESPATSPLRLLTVSEAVHKLDPISFKGNNYAEFPIDEDAYLETNITLQFKLDEKKDGILLFAGQLADDDFLSLAVDGPNIVFRHDCGEGTIEDMYHGELTVGKWHEVSVWRKNCDQTQMSLDGGRKLVDRANEFSNFKGISMDEGVFVGGAPQNIALLKEKAGTSEGIRGCIRKVIINNKVLLDVENNINKALDSFSLDFCGHQKSQIFFKKLEQLPIVEFDLTQHGIPVIEQIAELGAKTTPSPSTSSKPMTNSESSTTTSSLSTSTITADHNSTWRIAHFSGASKLSLPAPEDILEYLELNLQFKAEKPSGLLFFWQEGGKFLALTLENSFLTVYASLGADAAVIRTENAVSLYHWHRAEVWRSGKGILLKVNRQSWVEAQLHGVRDVVVTSSSEDSSPLHIGGHDGRLPAVVGKVEGFEGCIKRVRLNGRLLPLTTSDAVDVRECTSDPCATFGCPHGCHTYNSQPFCLCSWPTSGEKCQSQVDDDISAMSFTGNSYLELASDEILRHITGDELQLSVDFKLHNYTSRFDQVLFSASETSQSGDFVRLVVTSDRLVRFSIDLGSGVAVLTHPKQLVEEHWTTVEVIRKKRELTLSVNGEDPIKTIAPEGAEQLNVYHSVYVGGEPASSSALPYSTKTGLHGCVISLRLAETVVSHPRQAKSAINIDNCEI